MKSINEISEERIKQYALDGDYTCLDDYKYLFKKVAKEYSNEKIGAIRKSLDKHFKQQFHNTDEETSKIIEVLWNDVLKIIDNELRKEDN
jgi:hypothetical protein